MRAFETRMGNEVRAWIAQFSAAVFGAVMIQYPLSKTDALST